MVVWSMPTWPNLFFSKLVLNKTWNTTVSLFSCLNEFQTVCRVWELPKQRGGMTKQPASVLSDRGELTEQWASWVFPGCSPLCEGGAWPTRVRQGCCREALTFYSPGALTSLMINPLGPKYPSILFIFLACWPSPEKRPWCLFDKEPVLIIHWLGVLISPV